MTTTIRRRTSGAQYQVGHFDLPVVAGAVELLPPPIAKARAHLLDLIEQENLRLARLAVTAQAVTDADVLDAKALGDAIVAGEPDPGPVHAIAAKAAHAEAIRVAEGTQQAVHVARRALWDAMATTDRTNAVDALEALAAETIAPVAELLAAAMATITHYRGLRTLAAIMSTFPEVPAPAFVDVQEIDRAIATIREQITAMGPKYDAIHVRGADDGPEAA